MEERQQSRRIQTSILNGLERKALEWMARRLPRWVSSDLMTAIGMIGAVIIAVGYALSGCNVNWLWLASFGFLVNWFGDSLDGTIARVRHLQRPIYGFFLDHNVDCVNETVMFVGAGLSPFLHLPIAMGALVAYLLLSVYVYIYAHLKNEFKLTYAGFGPTELRVIVVIVNTLLIYVTPLREFTREFVISGEAVTFHLLDFVALAITLILLIFYGVSLVGSAREFGRMDPPKH
ncbi:MAG: CDP-alcohol phosphatidyltransferase family protein [Bacteroidales bacterium]|nr:CDP-alcohol phosphatidyltransferase family protein [Bacteroidales bacterium]